MAAQSLMSFTAAVRKLITEALSDDELNALCYDHLRPVSSKFGQGQSRGDKIQILIEYCEKHLAFPSLLQGIKKVNAARYEAFMAKYALEVVGLQAEYIPPAEMNPPDRTPQDRDGPRLAAARLENFDDFRFRDREELQTSILRSEANHIELYGPGGVGKTYLLQHIGRNEPHVKAVYIDLAVYSNLETVRAEVLRQLGCQPGPASTSDRDLGLAIRALHKPESGEPIDHFIFLFDSAAETHRPIIDWLVSEAGLINSGPFLDTLKLSGVRLDEIKLQAVIAARHPIVRIASFHANLHWKQFQMNRLESDLNPDRDPIQLMLQELADFRHFPIAQPGRQNISTEIYYLTGGHPKCAKLILFALAHRGFVPTPTEWQDCFKTCVLPVIWGEMLSSIQDARLLAVFQNLSVFRRFDQRLLAILLERSVLSGVSEEADISRQARSLRKRLSETYLVNQPKQGEAMYTLDYTVRRTLALQLQYDFPKRFRGINSIALEIFTGWLQSSETTPDRVIMCLIEVIYHWFKALEMADPPLAKTEICARVEQALENYLPLLVTVIPPVDWSIYLPQLLDSWQKDLELQEIIGRMISGRGCYQALTRRIERFVDEAVSDNIGDGISDEEKES